MGFDCDGHGQGGGGCNGVGDVGDGDGDGDEYGDGLITKVAREKVKLEQIVISAPAKGIK